uniref:Uncharacterized protein n=1 Tax=Cacopsylla melanoneura TaxID=428564 RepID=A0A8D8WPN6_9HEMI
MSKFVASEALYGILDKWFTLQTRVPQIHMNWHILTIENQFYRSARYIRSLRVHNDLPVQTFNLEKFVITTINVVEYFIISNRLAINFNIYITHDSSSRQIVQWDKSSIQISHLFTLDYLVSTSSSSTDDQELGPIQTSHLCDIFRLIGHITKNLGDS